LSNPESIKSGGIDFPAAAVLGGNVQPLSTKAFAFTFKNGTQRTFTGKSLLLTFSVPQFFFHVTTAYDVLRHAGVDLARKDFLGSPR
jgi:uncharacterized protein